MIPLPRCNAPLACPAAHSLSSRTSISRCGSPEPANCLYCSMFISWTRVFESFTSARKPELCVLISTHPLDLRADVRQFSLDFLITAIDVIDAVQQRFSTGHQTGEHQRRAGA